MAVDSGSESIHGLSLSPDDVFELCLDLLYGGHARTAAASASFLFEDRLAQFDALAADVRVPGTFDQRTDVSVVLAAKRAVRIAVLHGARRPLPG